MPEVAEGRGCNFLSKVHIILNDMYALCTCGMPNENLRKLKKRTWRTCSASVFFDSSYVISDFQLTGNVCKKWLPQVVVVDYDANAGRVVWLPVIWAKSHVIANKLYYWLIELVMCMARRCFVIYRIRREDAAPNYPVICSLLSRNLKYKT